MRPTQLDHKDARIHSTILKHHTQKQHTRAASGPNSVPTNPPQPPAPTHLPRPTTKQNSRTVLAHRHQQTQGNTSRFTIPRAITIPDIRRELATTPHHHTDHAIQEVRMCCAP